MSENRFRITTTPKSQSVAFDEKQKEHYIGIDLEDLLNEQQATIKQLEGKIKRLNAFLVERGLAIEYLKWKGDV